jgi:single-strand DNA-binding protein
VANLNRILLIGNLTRDPEVRYTSKGTAVAEIGLTVNRSYSGDDGARKEVVTFVDVTLWGRQAEFAQEYLKRGCSVFIEGRLQLDSWTDQSGQKKWKLRVVAESMQMLGAKPNQQQNPPVASKRPATRKQPEPTAATAGADKSVGHNEHAEPDDIPF